MGCRVRGENDPISKSVSRVCPELNSPHFSPWPQSLLSSRQVAWGWIEDRERLTYFSHPPPVSHLLYLSSHWRTNMNWPLQWVECKRNPNSLPLSMCVPFAMRHPAPPIKDWNLPQPLEFGLACDWLWSAEWGWGDGVSVPRLHLERPEHFHSLSWFLNTP